MVSERSKGLFRLYVNVAVLIYHQHVLFTQLERQAGARYGKFSRSKPQSSGKNLFIR